MFIKPIFIKCNTLKHESLLTKKKLSFKTSIADLLEIRLKKITFLCIAAAYVIWLIKKTRRLLAYTLISKLFFLLCIFALRCCTSMEQKAVYTDYATMTSDNIISKHCLSFTLTSRLCNPANSFTIQNSKAFKQYLSITCCRLDK